jgi:hypothetical protein
MRYSFYSDEESDSIIREGTSEGLSKSEFLRQVLKLWKLLKQTHASMREFVEEEQAKLEKHD